MSFEEAKVAYPMFRASDAPYICMDLVYQYSLLVDGFGKQPTYFFMKDNILIPKQYQSIPDL
jgi:apyrase